MKRLAPRLTYANVVATLALVIAVGGASAFAAGRLAKNSVGTKQIRNNAVTAAKIKNGAVTGAKIDLSTLGTVPSATNAVNATSAANASRANQADTAAVAGSAATAADARTLQGLSPSQIIASSQLRCPEGTALAAGLCFETAERPAKNWEEASLTCAKAGRRLPSPSELISYEVAAFPSSLPPLVEWTDNVSDINPGVVVMVVRATGSGSGLIGFEFEGFLGTEPYRCAVNPSN
jgi:hypothetical protein